jgi:hypothetical protein
VADIQLSSPDGQLWLLSRAECHDYLVGYLYETLLATWLILTSIYQRDSHHLFSDLTTEFMDEFALHQEGHVVTPQDWIAVTDDIGKPIVTCGSRKKIGLEIMRNVEKNMAGMGSAVRKAARLIGAQPEHSDNTLLRTPVQDSISGVQCSSTIPKQTREKKIKVKRPNLGFQ